MPMSFPRLAALVIPALALALGGCGFQPLYATAGGVAPALSGIEVETGEGRPSYLIGVALRDQLGTWSGDEAQHVLQTSASISRISSVLTVDQVATRIVMYMNVSYALYDHDTGQMTTRGSVVGLANYDVPAEPYAAIRAEEEATERAARDAAEKIAISLARYFSPSSAAT